MKTAAEYRVMADKCFKWARNTYMDEARETYLQLAQFWLDVASKLDGPPGSKPSTSVSWAADPQPHLKVHAEYRQ